MRVQELFSKWFAPKRVGYGYRPVTWQGWLLTLAPALLAALVSAVIAALRH
jgi:hypothetical protein